MISFQVGEWVSGTSMEDERIRGYIEEIEASIDQATIRVIESDRQEAVGEIVRSRLRQLKKLPVESAQSVGELMDLIDLALATRDKEWFDDLSLRLIHIQQKEQNDTKNIQLGVV
ncbi:IDEAL domain-containing protein [Seinonella peptonophila]|uniref:IDEAL domain-containing protein n=1 Tax=Seinonella peptonophila TaxID=112248 RepID=A0A1M4WBU1_9BACL|nr:IDEAL domain-containing protein [Seinonella peptonophila]SHE78699.1 IDEAL domain-containing protein [Seinonella peptonophila]